MKRSIYFKISIALLLFPIYGFSQANPFDSLSYLLNSNRFADTSKIKIYIELSEKTRKQNIDTAFYFANKALSLAEKKRNFKWLAFTKKQIGEILYRKEDYKNALIINNEALDIFSRLENQSENYFLVKLSIAHIYAKTGKQKEAQVINFDVAKKADSLDLPFVKVKAFYNIGNVYRLQRDGVKAVKYLQMAHDLASATGHTFFKFIAEHDLALAHDWIGEYQKEIALLKNCLNYSEFLGRNDSARIYGNIGRVYVIKLKNYAEGEKYLFKALELRKNLDVPFSLSHLYNEIATLYLHQSLYSKAVYYGEKSRTIAKELDNIRLLRDINKNLSDAYLGLKDYQKANEIEREYTSNLEYLFEKDKIEAITEMETRYETAKKEKEIAILEGKEKLARRTKNAFFFGLILLALISALVILLLRLRIKKKATEAYLVSSQLEVSQKELENKQLQLDNFARIIKEKNKMLEEITDRTEAGEIDVDFDKLQKLSKSIILTEEDWQNFQEMFEQVHGNFFSRLRHKLPEITPSEKRLISLMKLNLSNKEISNILGISTASVIKTKYRLKKKLSVHENMELEMVVAEI